MKNIIFAIALIASPAHALDKCGPNYELPNDLTPVEVQVLADFKASVEREEQLRIENNRIRDSKITNPEHLKQLHEMDRQRKAMKDLINPPGSVSPSVIALCMIRNGGDTYPIYTRSILRSRIAEITGWYRF